MVNNVRRDIRSDLHRAEVETEVPLTVQTFRKSYGQNHSNAGTPIHVLQRLIGHSSITTRREFYLESADANEGDALARYETLLDAPAEKTCVRLLYETISARPGEGGKSVSHLQQKT